MNYVSVIGLEVHLQLATQTKLFCGCELSFASKANSKTCPVCLGLPGSLPVINKKAIEYALKVAIALNCTIGEIVKFDRKNYYYPDLPKNYQISQYDMPLSKNGRLVIKSDSQEKTVKICRVHIEEDAGKLIHEQNFSLVDYNRSGTPLLEIVTEPDINSPDEAYNYLIVLKTLLGYLDVSDCDMEKGSLRCDANISLRNKNSNTLGVKAELKNMNSFKAVKAALEVEVIRQGKLLDKGESIIHETRLWDEENKQTLSMRSKEEEGDYRYFPDPDLLPLKIDKAQISFLSENLPELPQEKLIRFKKDLGVREEDAQFLIGDKHLARFFEDCLSISKDSKSLVNWMRGPLSYEMNHRGKDIRALRVRPKDVVNLIKFVEDDTLSNLSAKSVLSLMIDEGKSPKELIAEKNLSQICDEDSLLLIIKEVISQNQKSVDSYLSGKENAVMFLVGQVMKKSKGNANPKKAKELLERELRN